MNKVNNDIYNVPGLEKGLLVLEQLVNNSNGMTLQDLTSVLPVTPTTGFRILSTLLRMDYINYTEHGKIYRPSKKILRLGYKTIGEFDLLKRVSPVLTSLRDMVMESVFFGILGEEKGLFIEQSLGLYPFKFVLTSGSTFDLHVSAGGKAMLAFCDDSTRRTYLEKMTFDKYTDKTITSRSKFLLELEKVRQSGVAFDIEESMMGVVCVGAPILNYESKVVGAVWISGPLSRFSGKVMNDSAAMLKEQCSTLSQELGYQL